MSPFDLRALRLKAPQGGVVVLSIEEAERIERQWLEDILKRQNAESELNVVFALARSEVASRA